MIQKIPTKEEREALNAKFDAIEQELLEEFGTSWKKLAEDVANRKEKVLSLPPTSPNPLSHDFSATKE